MLSRHVSSLGGAGCGLRICVCFAPANLRVTIRSVGLLLNLNFFCGNRSADLGWVACRPCNILVYSADVALVRVLSPYFQVFKRLWCSHMTLCMPGTPATLLSQGGRRYHTQGSTLLYTNSKSQLHSRPHRPDPQASSHIPHRLGKVDSCRPQQPVLQLFHAWLCWLHNLPGCSVGTACAHEASCTGSLVCVASGCGL